MVFDRVKQERIALLRRVFFFAHINFPIFQVFTSSDTSPSEKKISAMFYDPKRDRLITGRLLSYAMKGNLCIWYQLPSFHSMVLSIVQVFT